jgi:hypothetical protein
MQILTPGLAQSALVELVRKRSRISPPASSAALSRLIKILCSNKSPFYQTDQKIKINRKLKQLTQNDDFQDQQTV